MMMKSLILAFTVLCILAGASFLKAQDVVENKPLLVVIDGEMSSQEVLDTIPQEQIEHIHYLMARDARAIYGMAAPYGALLVKTKKNMNPVIFKDGQPVSADTHELDFDRIDVIRGRQAINLYGPGARDGVLLLHTEEGNKEKRLDVLLEIVNSRGKPVKGATITDESGKVLAISNNCGMVYVENLLVGNNISIFSKKYQRKDIPVREKKVKIQLQKP
jgi:hypothetical protein